ncbi:ATP-binding protein [Jatrophihabitans sp.]|jgi:anti-sigma regulatory factor (Ser/Thr protein kinase)|uniref:ATP-binding protein n=1 Tax=Jatrophihabitans sp. TaxID=1932789 RepID=UPI002F1BF0AF
MSTLWVRHAPSSAAVARRGVLAAFDAAGLTTEQALDAALIASELVGNAVRHAAPLPSGQLAVSWSVDSDGYQISVTDGGVPGTTRPAIAARHAGCQDADGRGLRIVAELCDDWGVAARAGATTVWARTSTPAEPASA